MMIPNRFGQATFRRTRLGGYLLALATLLLPGYLRADSPYISTYHIFMGSVRRQQVLDSLRTRIAHVFRQPVTFGRDTALFRLLDRYYYHYSQLPLTFSEIVTKQVLYARFMERIARRNRWAEGLAVSAVWQARCLVNQGRSEAALTKFQRASRLCEQAGLATEQGMTLIHLAACLAYRKQYAATEWVRACQLMAQAKAIAERTGDAQLLHQYYNFMGDFHLIRGQYARALRFYEAERFIFEKHPDWSGRHTNLAYLGICHLHLGGKRASRVFLDAFFRESNPDEGNYALYLHHTVLLELARHHLRHRQWASALRYQRQYARILTLRPLYDRAAHYELMVQIHEGLGENATALRYYRRYVAARDSLKSEELSKRFADIEAQYASKRKENEIKELRNQALERENERQRTQRNLIGLAALLLVGILLVLLRANRIRRNHAETQAKLAQVRLETPLRVVDAQETERRRLAADLHDDVGSSLIALRYRLPENDEARQLLNKIIRDVRLISHNLMPAELADLGLNYALEQAARRFETASGIRFLFLASGTHRRLGDAAELTVYRLVLELMQNIVKHSEATEATVQLVYHDEELNVTVEDNGRGFDATAPPKGRSGIGLHTLSSRVTWLAGRVAVDSGAGGTTIRVDIPYARTFEETPRPAGRRPRPVQRWAGLAAFLRGFSRRGGRAGIPGE